MPSAARPVRRRSTAGGRQAADVTEGGCLFPEPRDLVVLGGELRDSGGLEIGEFGHDSVPLGDPIRELGDLHLEPFDLRGPGVDDLAGLLQSPKAPLELLGKVLVGAWPGLPSRFFFG